MKIRFVRENESKESDCKCNIEMYYFEAPRGILSLKNFETYATLRLNFLSRVLKCRNDINEFLAITTDPEIVAASDIFLEGSYKDLISHFTLR